MYKTTSENYYFKKQFEFVCQKRKIINRKHLIHCHFALPKLGYFPIHILRQNGNSKHSF
jgi:hypothetical protein